jgi:uncharacterized membrane protein YbjE (DUF340 family)
MPDDRTKALADLKRIIKWIVVIAVLMVVAALTYLELFGTLDGPIAIATTLGVFFSVLLGCGLFAVAFFSEKSGVDQQVADATRPKRMRAREPISQRKAS